MREKDLQRVLVCAHMPFYPLGPSLASSSSYTGQSVAFHLHLINHCPM